MCQSVGLEGKNSLKQKELHFFSFLVITAKSFVYSDFISKERLIKINMQGNNLKMKKRNKQTNKNQRNSHYDDHVFFVKETYSFNNKISLTYQGEHQISVRILWQYHNQIPQEASVL